MLRKSGEAAAIVPKVDTEETAASLCNQWVNDPERVFLASCNDRPNHHATAERPHQGESFHVPLSRVHHSA
jgi:hypothetical protein